jgi:hypothetical protein
MARHARESDFFTVTRPAPVLSLDEREQLQREAVEWGDRQRRSFAEDVELQAWIAANPEAAEHAVAEWMDAARLAGLLAPEVTRG